jgi:hypothetical protein
VSRGQTTRVVRAYSINDVPVRRPEAEGAQLGQLESMLLARVDGKRSIGDIGGLLELTIAEASLIVRRLVELEIVTIEPAKEQE